MERARILLELCIAYEHVNDRDKYAECFSDLVNLHSEIIDASTYQIFRNSVVIRKLANFLYRHKKYNEAKLIKERLEDSMVAGLNRPDDIMYMEDSKVNVLATAEVIFHIGNYSKVIAIGSLIVNAMENIQHSRYLHLESGCKLLMGRAKFHSGNYSEGLGAIESVFLQFAIIWSCIE